MSTDLDWDDFRFFRAIAAHGSVRGAAHSLGVNASTVTRRLDHLEHSLGAQLFTRSPAGLHITTAGVEVAHFSDEAGRVLARAVSSLQGRDQQLSGPLRVALPGFLVAWLGPELTRFADLYAGIELALHTDTSVNELASGALDVVLVDTDTPPPSMIGRPVTRVGIAAYGDTGYVLEEEAAWIEWTRPGVVGAACASLREQFFPEAQVRLQCDTLPLQLAALQSGIGAGMLPCIVGDSGHGLVRLDAMAPQAGPELWLLSHPDLRAARRVQVLLEFLREVFTSHAAALGGHATP